MFAVKIRFPILLAAGVCLVGAVLRAEETKTVRLRNETIRTSPAPRAALRPQGLEAVSGLYLIQFDATPSAALRGDLAGSGVTLLRYVPDDAFLARFENARMGAVRALPSVRWVGEYRPDHKVAAALRRILKAGQGTEVSIAFSPGAAAAEKWRARKLLSRVDRDTALPFGDVLRGTIDPGRLAALARSPAVLWIEPAPRYRLTDEIAAKIVGGGSYDPGEAGECLPDLGDFGEGEEEEFSLSAAGRDLGLHGPAGQEHQTTTQRLGFDGRGVSVAVADSGLHNGDADSMHPDLVGRVTAFLHYGTLPDASDENGHGTHVAGIVAGNGATGETDETGNLYGLGVAPGAEIVAQRLFDGLGRESLPPTFEVMTRDAVRAGADIGSNSWGEDTSEALGTTGAYDTTAAEFDALVRDADQLAAGDQPYILEFSAGNSGPGSQTILSPAVAKNVIATGASQNHRYRLFCLYEDGPDAMADFSSRGPTQDGRIKPDLVAPGTWIASLQSASASADNAWWPISENYQYQGGTSQAGPQVSGAAAVFVQFWRETHGGVTPSPALVKAALINGATDMDGEAGGTEPVPNFEEGWGRVTLTNLIGSARQLDTVDQSVTLTNGQAFERRIAVGDPRAPLVVTLTYTDPPALPAALPALVNDLDLEVEGPDGTLYRGNAFDQGESIPFAFVRDSLNNVEGVRIAVPEPGEYLVRVRATRVVEDIHGGAVGDPVQDFALVSASIPPLPGAAIVAFDRNAYRAPDLIQLRLVDFDLRGQATADLLVRSETEPAGELIRLNARGAVGVFTGVVATATGPAVPDGILQLADGNQIEAVYRDVEPVAEVEATSRADLVPPTLTGPRTTTRFARLLTEWDSSEPTTAVIEFGATADLGLALTNRVLSGTHVFALPDVSAGQPVYFRLRARDEAGNETVRDDNGVPFRAVPERAATVLLVNTSTGGGGLFELGSLDAYKEALAESGVDHEVWDILDTGKVPSLEDLRPYRVVIWRPDELAVPSSDEVRAMRDFVAAGGGLFVSSIEILSRLDEGGFESFRRNVLRVESYTADAGVDAVVGLENVSLTSGLALELDYTFYEFLVLVGVQPADTFEPADSAEPILFDGLSGEAVGVRYPRTGADAAGRVVFLSFPLDAVPAEADEPNTRGTLLRRALGFLAPGAIGEGTLQLDRESYSVPGRVTIEVSSARHAGQSRLDVAYSGGQTPGPESLSLSSTPVPGVFRGALTLADAAVPKVSGVLPVADGDRFEVRWTPQPGQESLVVSGFVDTSPPEIREVTVEADYTEAIVRWETSEPAEALVEFGESGFLNRTAYRGSLAENHEVRLSGLQPDREYVFAVTSRDGAGNATRDDNGGVLYRLRTLKPLAPPFVDALDGDDSRWDVVNESLDAETLSMFQPSAWSLGAPANELADAGHTGTQAWGTNLRGEGNDLASTWLISPAIALTGGSRAVLRFWQHYDFLPRSADLDIAEAGGVYVTTDNGTAWVSLRDYSEATDGWEAEEIDLTPYAGQVVRVAWAYVLISLDPIVHPGWLVDDISITVESFVPATLIISNNVSQASVGIRGPLNRIERGRTITLTNAPPGEYQFDFGDIPYFVTPPSRTNTLAEGGVLVVSGDYSFADVNGNGLSDAWEQQFLGGARPGALGTADTDGDGANDLAEFRAGTNPTNALSLLSLQIGLGTPASELELRWEAGGGRSCRVLGSTNGVDWVPVGGWLRTVEGPNSTRVSVPGGGEYLYRLELQP